MMPGCAGSGSFDHRIGADARQALGPACNAAAVVMHSNRHALRSIWFSVASHWSTAATSQPTGPPFTI